LENSYLPSHRLLPRQFSNLFLFVNLYGDLLIRRLKHGCIKPFVPTRTEAYAPSPTCLPTRNSDLNLVVLSTVWSYSIFSRPALARPFSNLSGGSSSSCKNRILSAKSLFDLPKTRGGGCSYGVLMNSLMLVTFMVSCLRISKSCSLFSLSGSVIRSFLRSRAAVPFAEALLVSSSFLCAGLKL
jgi:hypothetical protein